jgi:hypothetical protein
MSETQPPSNGNPPAGLAFAPNYDSSQELDPNQAEAIQPEGFDVHKLAYYQELERQRSFKIRAGLMAMVFAMIAANMWMVQSNRDSMIDANAQINAQLNQATSDRSVIVDQLELSDMSQHLDAISERLERIETQLVGQEAVAPAVD